MAQRGGHSAAQSMQLDTMLFINDELVGAPGEHSRTRICPPHMEEESTPIFMTSYMVPEHDYTYIQIKVVRWSSNQKHGLSMKTLGTIEVPMVACQTNEPRLEVLTNAEAGKLVGVEACSYGAVRYTLTGTPRFHYAEYTAGLPQDDIPEELNKIASLIDGKSPVALSLLHPIRGKLEDATQDFTYSILEDCTRGWLRDGGKPWDVYYANSRYNRVLDLDTVPKGEAIPYLDQVPARNTFDHREQYAIRMAVGNQQEKEFHDRHRMKLMDYEVPVRLIADPRSLHPTSKAPQHYFAIIDPSDASSNVDYLLPRDGDRADFIIPSTLPNRSTDPIRLPGYRVNVPSKLWSSDAQVWKSTVPVDKATGSANLPLVLDVRDASIDDVGKPLTLGAFTELGESGEASINIKMEVIDSDKTHKAEMTALKKLSAPHTMPEDDRPSLASLTLFDDVVKADLRDEKPLKEFMPDLEMLRQGKHPNKHLQYFYKRLSKDKHKAIQHLLDNKKRIKYVHGPPGTGKTHLAFFIICITLMFDPPKDDVDRDRSAHLRGQLNPEEFDEVDQTAPLRPVPLTDAQKAATSETPRTKILIVCGQNKPVDDLYRRFKPMWDSLGGRKGGKHQPKAVRLYSWEIESKDFAGRFIKTGRHIQQTVDDESAGGSLMRLLNGFSKKVDEFDGERQRTRDSSYSIVDMAVELFQKERENGKYERLSNLINQVSAKPDLIYTNGEEISRLVQSGPQKDALAQADVVFATPVGVAEKNFREIFRPHYIISDENPRDKEITTLILLAHFSPKAYLFFGDHQQLRPIIFSTHQHRKYKPPRSFKPADEEPASGLENLGGDDAAPAGHEQGTAGPSQTAAGNTDPKETKPEKSSDTKDAPVQEEEILPRPATFALQLERSMISRLLVTGLPCAMLKENYRQHGLLGQFFSGQFYNKKVKFAMGGNRFSPVDKAAINWLVKLSGKEDIKGNSLMIDMSSRDNCQARSYSNVGHVNFVLAHIADLLGNRNFRPTKNSPDDGKIMIIVPYEAQKKLYECELEKRASKEKDSEGKEWVDFPKDQVEIRSHQGAQGYEASVVIMDLVRSDSPGHTGNSDLINVCSSRAICAQLVLVNTSVFNRVESMSSPYVKSLAAWVRFHDEYNMLIKIEVDKADEWRVTCSKCYGLGHKANECMYTITNARIICPIPSCGENHHPRDCCKYAKQ